MRALKFLAALAACAVWLTPPAAEAQSANTGTIAGVVKDATGAVLPGVTVEAASPALIEKVRNVVTDESGNYKIVDLRPGTYSVTFTLPGFNTFRREGIELTGGFTANVAAEMRVGGVEETITVTGASPIVDVQNVRNQNVISAKLMNDVPTARNFIGMTALTLGATGGGGFTGASGNRDVGGNNGEGVTAPAIHGSRTDGALNIEGMKTNSLSATGASRRFHPNQLAIQETVLETGGMSAETETGGVSSNLILREGSNAVSGAVEGDYTGDKLQGTNLSDTLRARGLAASNSTKYIYSGGGTIGAPLKKDQFWFNTSLRMWGNEENLAGIYYNKPELQGTRFFQADLTNPGHIGAWVKDNTSRLTFQASPKNKMSGVFTAQKSCSCNNSLGPTRAPETTIDFIIGTSYLTQVNWNRPQTNKLLFEAGFAARNAPVVNNRQPEVSASTISMLELSTGLVYNAFLSVPGTGGFGNFGRSDQYNTAGAVSYITGSHAMKMGFQTLTGTNPAFGQGNEPPIQYQFRNGVPTSILQVASPGGFRSKVNLNMGLFLQDQWTLKRLTLNLGLRYDTLVVSNPASVRPAGMFLGEIKFDEVKNVPNWKDVNPRVGAAYDLFGNGKTAVKASFGRYVISESLNVATATNPSSALAASVTRTWSDANGNFAPDCTLTNNQANGECGAASSTTFGTSVFNLRYDPDYLKGFAVRPYNWQASASVQQEIGKGLGLSVGYFRTWYGNITVTDNLAITPADFDQFCVTAPTDSRLGDVSGTQICGLYDIKPEKFGLTNNLVRTEDGRTEVFNGVDVALRARFGNGGTLGGGVSLGQTTLNNCTVVDNPGYVDSATAGVPGGPESRFCETGNSQHQVKLNVSYPLFWGIQASGIYQNLPGTDNTARVVVGNAAIAPSLGRNLGSCRGAATCNGTVSVALIEPFTVREKRASQLDVRLSKTVKFGEKMRARVGFDVYNLLNSNDVLSVTTAYGAAWLRPGGILAARIYKFNARFDF